MRALALVRAVAHVWRRLCGVCGLAWAAKAAQRPGRPGSIDSNALNQLGWLSWPKHCHWSKGNTGTSSRVGDRVREKREAKRGSAAPPAPEAGGGAARRAASQRARRGDAAPAAGMIDAWERPAHDRGEHRLEEPPAPHGIPDVVVVAVAFAVAVAAAGRSLLLLLLAGRRACRKLQWKDKDYKYAQRRPQALSTK
eukprot:gene14379-biopygen154